MTAGLAVIVVNYGSHELLIDNLAGIDFVALGDAMLPTRASSGTS